MKRADFISDVKAHLTDYMGATDIFDGNSQLSVNPDTLSVTLVNNIAMQSEIADSVEAIEAAAASQGDESESATDYQVLQNPDLYPVSFFLKCLGPEHFVIDDKAVERLADSYNLKS